MKRQARREPQGYHRRRPAAWLAAALVLAALLFPFPPAGRLVDALTDLVHVPLFAVVAGAAALWLHRRGRSPAPALLLAWAGAVAAGLVIEVLQGLVGREASMGDLWADAAGASAGLLIAAGRLAGARPRRRGMRLAAAVLAALAGACWPGLRLFDIARLRLDPSRLATFEDALQLDRWSFDGSRAARSPDHASEGRYALRVELEPGRYPGAGLTSPPRDWSAYGRFQCDLFLEGSAPLDLRIKVEDERHNGLLSDRFQLVLRVLPGPSRLEIPLAGIAEGPRGRRLDLTRVAQVRFFAVDLEAPRVLFIDGVTLIAR